MGQVKSSDSSRLRQYVSDFKDVFTSDGKVLFCRACGKFIVTQQRSHVTQHISGNKHIAAIVRLKQKDRPGKQSLIGESSATSSSSGPSKFSTFAADLCKAFVSADIPLFKINNPNVRNFLLKYTQTDPTEESILRKNYVPKCYEETWNKVRVLCGKDNIWVSIGEITNASGRKVANIVIGVLKNDQTLSEKSFLLSCKEMSAVNHITIARVFNEAVQTLWPGEGLSVSYPKLIHVTCTAYALHRVYETIRVLYPNVDKLVGNGQKIFVKSPARIEFLKNKAPDTSLPPTPVITRWGTWLDATVHHAENFEIFCSVVNKFDGDDASSITIFQDIFQDSNELKTLKTDLAYIRANFSFLFQSITKLQMTTNLLSETIKEIKDIEDKLKKISDSKADAVKQKFRSCIRNNKGFKVTCDISCVLEAEDQVDFEDLEDLSVSYIECYKYERIVSCDVERTSSQYK
jgi:hypothetical protein